MRELPTHMPKSQPCPKCGKWVKRSKLITYKEDSNVGAEYYCKKDDLTFFEPDHLVPQLVMQRLRELKMAKKDWVGWLVLVALLGTIGIIDTVIGTNYNEHRITEITTPSSTIYYVAPVTTVTVIEH